MSAEILEEFDGVLDRIIEDVAHVTLTSKLDGQVFWAEFTAQEMAEAGIREHRRFRCTIIRGANGPEAKLEMIPDKELTDADEARIRDEVNRLLGDDEGEQDDY